VDYVSVMKPRLVGLFLFTVVAAMLLAGGPRPLVAAAVLAATAATVAGAAVLNNYLERDSDALMARTRRRASARGVLKPRRVLALGVALVVSGTAALYLVSGPLAAGLAAAGAVYYVLVYTLVIKPRTALSAVPGALTGVFPALIGWAAAGAPHSLGVLFLCTLIAAWSPPHFWALAFALKDEYVASRIPVPAVRYGERRSALQILQWVVALAALAVLPAAAGVFGSLYAVIVVAASLAFGFVAWRLAATRTAAMAWLLYKLSGPYLAVVMLAMLADRLVQPLSVATLR
jgi:heme o synthase